MKPANLQFPRGGFTLIEMIGVLAIMAILASVIVPNVVHTMDRAAVEAERKTLETLGEQVGEYLRTNGTTPTSAWPNLANLAQRSWCTDLAGFSDIPTRDIAVNRRDNVRVILFEPGATPTKRIILVSSMHAGPPLPDSTYTPSAAQFQQLWDTPDGQVPPTSSWSGWANWRVLDGSNQMWLRHYLLIERVDLRPVLRTELASFTFRLNNRGPSAVSFDFVPPLGTGSFGTVNAGSYAEVTLLRHSRLNLYRDATHAAAALDYSYIVGADPRSLTFDFQDGTWTPQ